MAATPEIKVYRQDFAQRVSMWLISLTSPGAPVPGADGGSRKQNQGVFWTSCDWTGLTDLR